MSDSTPDLDQLATGQTAKEAAINELLNAASPSTIFARRAATSALLTWGYYGGRWGGVYTASGTIALTASATNYLVRKISDGSISVSTSVTNWNDTNNYQRLYKIVTDAAGPTSYEDHRGGAGGVVGIGQAAYTQTTASYTQPSVSASVAASFASTAWMTAGMMIYITGGGFYTVASIDSSTSASITNLNVAGNASAGATVASGAGVAAAGAPGVNGTAGVGTIPTTVKTGTYAAFAFDFVPFDLSAGNGTLNLPSTPADGSIIGAKIIALSGSFTLTVNRGGTDVFNVSGGSTSLSLSLLNQGVLLNYKGGIWYVMADDFALAQLDARYLAATALDTDGTLAANSDAKIPSQKAIKTYVDAKVAGLSWKQAVRAGTTVAGTLASSFTNGSVIDGVTLATGDRILIKNQATGSENGIYVVPASGAPTRATDADAGAELVNASVYISEGTTLADTQWTCSTNAPITVGSTSLTFSQLATGGSGLTNWTEAITTASPNGTTPVSSFTPNNAATNVDAALRPKGNGAVLAQIPDGTATGGSKRGANAVDWQTTRSAAGQIASSANAVIGGGSGNTASGSTSTVAGGSGNTASGTSSSVGGGASNSASGNWSAIPGGSGNTASGTYCTAAGNGNSAGGSGTVAMGRGNTTSGNYSSARGYNANDGGLTNVDCWGMAFRASSGDRQTMRLPVAITTTNTASATTMTSDAAAPGAANQLVLPSGQVFKVRAQVVAKRSSDTAAAGWDVSLVVKNVGGTMSIVGTPTITQQAADTGVAAYTVTAAVDSTNKALQLQVSGGATDTVYWKGLLEAECVG